MIVGLGIRVLVWMELLAEKPVGFLDFAFRGIFLNPK